MDVQTRMILLGCGAGLLAAALFICLCLLLRRCLKSRRHRTKPLSQCERRVSVREVKRYPLHAPVGIPVQPSAEVDRSAEAALYLEQYGRRRHAQQERHLLRAALSRSMEHLVLEPGAAPTYSPPGRDDADDSVSPSELSSVCSDEEVQSVRAESTRARMHFHVVYSAVAGTVTVCLNQLENVSTSRVHVIRVTALGQQAISGPVTPPLTQPMLLLFRDVQQQWLLQGQLSCHLYQRRFVSLTEKLVGEASVRLSELRLASGQPASCCVSFSKPGTRRTIPLQPSHSAAAAGDQLGSSLTAAAPGLGQLLLSLRYQPGQERMTLFLRRGDHLPESKALVAPEYYVTVMLLRAGDVCAQHESRHVSGRAPVWNQSFYFNIAQSELGIHWIQCILMVSRIYARDRRVGFCQLGPDTNAAGSEHWQLSIRPGKEDASRWHPLLPAPQDKAVTP